MNTKGIALIRKKHGLTQDQLASLMSVSRSRVKNIENGNDLTVPVLLRYLKACGLEAKFGIFDSENNHLSSISHAEMLSALRKIRQHSALTQNQLAEKISLSRSRIEQIELGTDDIKISTLNKYVSACGFRVMLDVKKIENIPPPLENT